MSGSALPSSPFLATLSGIVFVVLGAGAVPESADPPSVLTAPQIPPLDIPEVDLSSTIIISRIEFDREFDLPVGLATLPEGNGEQVVALQRGEFCTIDVSATRWRPFLDFRHRLVDQTSFEDGVHGFTFHPRFAENRLFYLSYSQNNPRRTVISEMRATPGSRPVAMPETERLLIELPQPLDVHWGGNLVFGPDGRLYIGIGDGGLRGDPYRLAQNPWSLHGKILRIDVDGRSGTLPYAIPPDNPFTQQPAIRPEIFALGFRNPWGLSFDTVTGELWCADVGEHLWEEINRVGRGTNHGWSDRDGPTRSMFHQEPSKSAIPFTEPVHAYSRMRGEGICIVGGLLYRGRDMPALNGAFLFADWGYGAVWALQTDPQTGTASRRFLLRRPGGTEKFNPTLVTSDSRGEPIVLSQEGNLYRIEDESD